MSREEHISRDLLFEFAFGGLAENIDAETRETLHIDTPIDGYLEAAVDNGYRVILTGNPGDGKTQHLLIHRSRFAGSKTDFYQPTADGDLDGSYDVYYEPDGSRLRNRVVLDRLQTAVDEEIPGILAINEGVIQEMIHDFSSEEYKFIDTIQRQIRNQLVYETDSKSDQHEELNDIIQEEIKEFGIVVIDLGLRNVLTEGTINEALDLLESHIVQSENGDTHITRNVDEICNSGRVRENIIQFLQTINHSTPDTHYTVRDLFQFLSAVTTGGKRQGRPDYSPELAYYNLVFEPPDRDRRGVIGKAVDELFTTTRVVHPQIDAKLWTKVERKLTLGDDEEEDEFQARLRKEFTELKRKTLFDPEDAFDTGLPNGNVNTESTESVEMLELLRGRDEPFSDFMNSEELLYKTIKLTNQYFDRTSGEDSKLFLWTSQTYKSSATDALVSRTDVRAEHFDCRFPTLNRELKNATSLDDVDQAIEFLEDHYQFAYSGEVDVPPVSIRIDSQFWDSFQFLDIGIPYELRSDQQEQRLLRFMERVENRQSLSPREGDVKIQNTSESNVSTIKVKPGSYIIEENQ